MIGREDAYEQLNRTSVIFVTIRYISLSWYYLIDKVSRYYNLRRLEATETRMAEAHRDWPLCATPAIHHHWHSVYNHMM